MLQKAVELEVTEFLGRDHYQRSGDGALQGYRNGYEDNLLERLFGEGRRRSKVIPRFMSERSGLSLLFAVLVDASGTWHGIKITPAIGQELEGLTKNSGAKPSPQLAS